MKPWNGPLRPSLKSSPSGGRLVGAALDSVSKVEGSCADGG